MNPLASLVPCAGLALALLPLAGCSSYTYQAQEWRVTAVGDDAQVSVRYTGIGAATTNPVERAEALDKVEQLAADVHPSSPLTPSLRNVTRKVYVEGNSLIIEETGTRSNPLSWLQQLNMANDLSVRSEHIVLKDIGEDRIVLASNGRVLDEDTYTRLFRNTRMPVNLGTDTRWMREGETRPDEIAQDETLQVIVWPREARMFYWKLSSPSYKDYRPWYSLAPDYLAHRQVHAAVDTPPAEDEGEPPAGTAAGTPAPATAQ